MARLGEINDKRMALGLNLFELEAYDEAVAWDDAQTAVKPGDLEQKETPPAEPVVEPTAVKPVEEPKKETPPAMETPPPAPIPDKPQSGDSEELVELKKELQKLKSEHGRTSVLSNEVKDLKVELEAEKLRADTAEKTARLKTSTTDLSTYFTEEQLETADADTLKMAAIMAEQMAEAKADAIVTAKLSELSGGNDELRQMIELQSQRTSERDRVENETRQAKMNVEIQKSVPNEVYAECVAHPEKWKAWGQTPFAGTTKAVLYANALTAFDSGAAVTLLNEFAQTAGIEVPTKGKKPPLKPATSSSGAKVTDSSADADYRYEEVMQIMNNRNQRQKLPVGWKQSDFDTWLDKVIDAADKGHLVDNQGNRHKYLR